MSYNIENLFDLVDNGKEFSEYKPDIHIWNHETQAKKLDNIASVIAASHADICVLVEVENLNAAVELQKTLKRKKRHFTYIAAGDKPNPATTCQVILSRFPITASAGIGIPKKGKYYTRNILEADIAAGPDTLKIFAVHLPSKRFPESFRIAAVQTLLHRLKQLDRNTDYVIAGDFNSNYNEAETFFTERLDNTQGTTAINHLLKTANSAPGEFLDFVSEQELLLNPDSLYHYNPWLELSEHRRFNYKFRGQNNTLDHILLPRSLYDSSGISYLDNSFCVFYWDGRLLYNGLPYRWKTVFGRAGKYHAQEGYSDHLPVMAKFISRPCVFADTRTDHSPHADTIADKNLISGFETGFEGWIPYNFNFRVSRDTADVQHGRYCLKIEGFTKNSCGAAHIVLPTKKYNHGKSISLNIKGAGKFVFRMRTDSTKWICYTENNFTRQLKSTRYTTFSSKSWQKTALLLPKTAETDSAVELEIRAAGNERLCIWMDNIRINF